MGYLAWRQGNHEAAWPSVETIARNTHVSERTVQRRLRELEELGYLITTPRHDQTNLYMLVSNPEGTDKYNPDSSDNPGCQKRHPRGDKSDTQNDRTRTRETYTSDEDRLYDRYPKARNEWDLYVEALAEVCSVDIGTAPKDEMGKIYQSARILRDNERNPATPAQILAFKEWWYEEHWIGRDKGEPPRPSQVRKEWGRFTDSLQGEEDPNSGWEWA